MWSWKLNISEIKSQVEAVSISDERWYIIFCIIKFTQLYCLFQVRFKWRAIAGKNKFQVTLRFPAPYYSKCQHTLKMFISTLLPSTLLIFINYNEVHRREVKIRSNDMSYTATGSLKYVVMEWNICKTLHANGNWI